MDYVMQEKIFSMIRGVNWTTINKFHNAESAYMKLKQPVMISEPLSLAQRKYLTYGSLPFFILGDGVSFSDEMLRIEYEKVEKMWRLNFHKIQMGEENIRVPIYPTGNVNAKYMVIGDEPTIGFRQCKGALTRALTQSTSSLLLRKSLLSIGLLHQCWFTNYFKLPPSKGSFIGEEEVALNYVYLQRELEIIKPECIIILGNHVADMFSTEFADIARADRKYKSKVVVPTPLFINKKGYSPNKYGKIIEAAME